MVSSDLSVGFLVDPDWIAQHLDDPALRLVEVDVSASAYVEGHLPGAVLWNAYSDLRHPGSYIPIDRSELDLLLAGSGIAPGSTVVSYGYGQYLGFWLLRHHGHADVRLMDGSRDRWSEAGYPWSAECPEPDCAEYSSFGHPTIQPDLATVRGHVADGDRLLLDVRSVEEFAGARFWPSGAAAGAGRAGRLPGSIHLPAESLRDANGALRSRDELAHLCEAAGVPRDRPITTYCTIGNRASQVWFALTYVLGFPDVDVYYGSWAEWGTSHATPIEI